MSAAATITRRSGTSFYYAFLLLPARKRRAIFALYSFCRAVDDCVDEAGGGGEAGLDAWLLEIERCHAGEARTALGRELSQALREFSVPRACLEDVVAGCRMDLTVRRYATYDDLALYCRRVASAVGLASIEIFGYRNPATRDYASALGLALQLTNILRDLRSDAARDRIYVPLDDLSRFGVGEAEFLTAVAQADRARPQGVRELLAFQAERSREQYRRAGAALPAEDRRAMVAARAMGAVYRELLEEVVRRGFPARRVAFSRARKGWIALRTLAAAWSR